MSNLRLSEAMRLGAMLKPQAFGVFHSWRSQGTCAQGAALDAVGELMFYAGAAFAMKMAMYRLFPILRCSGECPGCQKHFEKLRHVVRHLNNDHRWSRERIADWVSTIEQEHERQQAAEVQKEAVTA